MHRRTRTPVRLKHTKIRPHVFTTHIPTILFSTGTHVENETSAWTIAANLMLELESVSGCFILSGVKSNAVHIARALSTCSAALAPSKPSLSPDEVDEGLRVQAARNAGRIAGIALHVILRYLYSIECVKLRLYRTGVHAPD
jgi:hypothetical protein